MVWLVSILSPISSSTSFFSIFLKIVPRVSPFFVLWQGQGIYPDFPLLSTSLYSLLTRQNLVYVDFFFLSIKTRSGLLVRIRWSFCSSKSQLHSLEVFHTSFNRYFFHWSLSDSKYPKVSNSFKYCNWLRGFCRLNDLDFSLIFRSPISFPSSREPFLLPLVSPSHFHLSMLFSALWQSSGIRLFFHFILSSLCDSLDQQNPRDNKFFAG